MSLDVGLHGKVDEVPGVGHVATTFLTAAFFPLIPAKSWFVLDDPAPGEPRRRLIPLSGKSIVVAWARAACTVALLLGGLGVLHALDRSRDDPLAAASVAAGFLGLLALRLRVFTRAGPERARALTEEYVASPAEQARLELARRLTQP